MRQQGPEEAHEDDLDDGEEGLVERGEERRIGGERAGESSLVFFLQPRKRQREQLGKQKNIFASLFVLA